MICGDWAEIHNRLIVVFTFLLLRVDSWLDEVGDTARLTVFFLRSVIWKACDLKHRMYGRRHWPFILIIQVFPSTTVLWILWAMMLFPVIFMNLRQFPFLSGFRGDTHPFQLLTGQKARDKRWRGMPCSRLLFLLLLLWVDYHGANGAQRRVWALLDGSTWNSKQISLELWHCDCISVLFIAVAADTPCG